MNASTSIERAKAYLDVQISPADRKRSDASLAPFVTISRETGAGATALADELCRQLNRRDDAADRQWTALDRDVVERVLENHGLPIHLARYVPEDRVPEIQAAVGEIVGLHPNVWSLVQQTGEFMRRVAAKGHVVFVGRGANFATEAGLRGFHVRLVGSIARRTARIREQLRLSETEALAHIHRTDAARRDYVRSYYARDIEDPHAYHLTLNTDELSPAQQARVVIASMPWTEAT